jgi:ABC-2 type transport system permease protein
MICHNTIRHNVIWHKTWLESRTRFLAAAVLVAAISVWVIVSSERGMARFDIHPPITFAQYVALVCVWRIELVWVAAVLFLGLGGLMRERALGTAAYTLSLPVSRRRWMATRAAVGAVESGILALVPAIAIPAASLWIGRTYPVAEALKFSGLMMAAGLVFFATGFFWSSVLPSDYAAAGMGALSLYLTFTAQDYLYRWLPAFGMSRLLSGAEYVNRATGFLQSCDWSGVAASLAAALALFLAATQIMQLRDL